MCINLLRNPKEIALSSFTDKKIVEIREAKKWFLREDWWR